MQRECDSAPPFMWDGPDDPPDEDAHAGADPGTKANLEAVKPAVAPEAFTAVVGHTGGLMTAIGILIGGDANECPAQRTGRSANEHASEDPPMATHADIKAIVRTHGPHGTTVPCIAHDHGVRRDLLQHTNLHHFAAKGADYTHSAPRGDRRLGAGADRYRLQQCRRNEK